MYDFNHWAKEKQYEIEKSTRYAWMFRNDTESPELKAYRVLEQLLDNQDATIRLKAAELLVKRKSVRLSKLVRW